MQSRSPFWVLALGSLFAGALTFFPGCKGNSGRGDGGVLDGGRPDGGDGDCTATAQSVTATYAPAHLGPLLNCGVYGTNFVPDGGDADAGLQAATDCALGAQDAGQPFMLVINQSGVDDVVTQLYLRNVARQSFRVLALQVAGRPQQPVYVTACDAGFTSNLDRQGSAEYLLCSGPGIPAAICH